MVEKFESGFLGFYIVIPSRRRQKIGMALWRAGMQLLSSCRNVGLDGVVEQQPNYRKSGFTYAYANVRYEGRASHTSERSDTAGTRTPSRAPALRIDGGGGGGIGGSGGVCARELDKHEEFDNIRCTTSWFILCKFSHATLLCKTFKRLCCGTRTYHTNMLILHTVCLATVTLVVLYLTHHVC